jgi:hypothetical protein
MEGLDLERLPLGTRARLGPTATVELTGLRTPCVLIGRFRKRLKEMSARRTLGTMRHLRCLGPSIAGDEPGASNTVKYELDCESRQDNAGKSR